MIPVTLVDSSIWGISERTAEIALTSC